MAALISQLERFESKFIKVDTECWEWTAGKPAARSGKQYGSFWYNGKMKSAHIVSYELYVGPVPEGKVLDHTCKNPPCVNPDHLEPVTQKENVHRGRLSEVRRQALKTHCRSGHPLSGDNLAVWGGQRYCKECNAARSRKSYGFNH